MNDQSLGSTPQEHPIDMGGIDMVNHPDRILHISDARGKYLRLSLPFKVVGWLLVISAAAGLLLRYVR